MPELPLKADFSDNDPQGPAAHAQHHNDLAYYINTGGGGGGGSAVTEVQEFVATAGQTLFTLAQEPTGGTLRVFLNGILLKHGTHYTQATTNVTLADPSDVGDQITAIYDGPSGPGGGEGGGHIIEDSSGTDLAQRGHLQFVGATVTDDSGNDRTVITIDAGGGAGGRTHIFSKVGTLAATAGVHRLYNDTAEAWTIVGIRASVGTAPAGQSFIVDVNKNGTTVFTTQANRPVIGIGANTSGKVTNMNVTTVAIGDYLTVDIDQVGTTTAGSDLVVQVEVQ